MYKLVISCCFWVICTFSFGKTELPPVFNSDTDNISLGKIRNFYLSNYMDLHVCDSMAQEVSEILKVKNNRLYLLNEFARVQILSFKGDNVEALKVVQKLGKNENIKHDKVLSGYYYNVYGVVYYDMQQYEEAKEKYSLAVNSFKFSVDSSGLKGNLINLGNACLELNQVDSAFQYYFEAKILEENGVEIFSQTLISNFAQAYTRVDSLDKAKQAYETLIIAAQKSNNSYQRVVWTFNLANVLGKMNSHTLAVEYYLLADSLSKQYSYPQFSRKANYGLATSFYNLKEFEKSIEHYQAYDKYKPEEDFVKFEKELSNIEFKHQEELNTKEQNLITIKLETERKQSIMLAWYITMLSSLALLLLIAYWRIRHKNKSLILTNYELATRDKKDANINDEKTIDKDLITNLKIELEQKKVFTNEGLSLEKLAKKLGTNRSYLSEAINVYYEESYSSLINKHRIQEARLMLISDKYAHYSIEGIAKSVGYKNISSFNTSFKKHTGITPSYFRKEGQKAEKQQLTND